MLLRYLVLSIPVFGLNYAATLQKRECQAQQLGSGPTVSPDTPAAFQAFQAFSDAANNATTPLGYISTYTNLLGETQGLGFEGSWLLDSYNTTECAAMCDARDGCMAFNIAFERQPVVQPGPDCNNPNSTTWIKCTLWGGPADYSNAINQGQWSYNFQVVIAGSNGYVNHTLTDASGYAGPQDMSDQAVVAPLDCNNKNTSLGYIAWNDGLFDSSRCAQQCTTTLSCQFFNTYMLIQNYLEVTQVCAMFTQTWSPDVATASSMTFNGTAYSVIKSYGYSNATNPGFCKGASYTQIGCYRDQGGPRTLNYTATIPSGNQLTLDACSCACANYTYFGTEYGSECYCGNSLVQAQTIGPADNCNMACNGNSSQACGGSWSLNIYQQSGTLPASCAPVPYSYLGCYTDAPAPNRNYPYDVENSYSGMTRQICVCACIGYAYFGLQYGGECWCGNSMTLSNQHGTSSKCNMACGGNSSQTCGGSYAMNQYQYINTALAKNQCGK